MLCRLNEPPINTTLHVLRFDPRNVHETMSVYKTLTTNIVMDREVSASGTFHVCASSVNGSALLWDWDEEKWISILPIDSRAMVRANLHE